LQLQVISFGDHPGVARRLIRAGGAPAPETVGRRIGTRAIPGAWRVKGPWQDAPGRQASVAAPASGSIRPV